MTDSIACCVAAAGETKREARGNIFGVNLSARILQGRWEICRCTQAYAGTWNFMRCSVSINPSLQRALRLPVRIRCLPSGYLCASIAHVHMYSLLSCSLFDNIDSSTGPPPPARDPIVPSKTIRHDFFSTLCRTCGILVVTWHSSRILSDGWLKNTVTWIYRNNTWPNLTAFKPLYSSKIFLYFSVYVILQIYNDFCIYHSFLELRTHM